MAMPVVPLFLTNLYSFKLSFRSDLNVSKNAEKKKDSATEPHDENVSSRRLHSTQCENDFTGTASNELPCHEAQRFCKFLLQCEPQVVQKVASSPEPQPEQPKHPARDVCQKLPPHPLHLQRPQGAALSRSERHPGVARSAIKQNLPTRPAERRTFLLNTPSSKYRPGDPKHTLESLILLSNLIKYRNLLEAQTVNVTKRNPIFWALKLH